MYNIYLKLLNQNILRFSKDIYKDVSWQFKILYFPYIDEVNMIPYNWLLYYLLIWAKGQEVQLQYFNIYLQILPTCNLQMSVLLMFNWANSANPFQNIWNH